MIHPRQGAVIVEVLDAIAENMMDVKLNLLLWRAKNHASMANARATRDDMVRCAANALAYLMRTEREPGTQRLPARDDPHE